MINNKVRMWLILGLILIVFLEISARVFFFWRVNFSSPYVFSATDWRMLWASEKAKTFSTAITDAYHPVLGWVPVAGLKDVDLFGWAMFDVNTNSKGVRGQQEYSYRRNSKTRILVFGDSFTWGQEVNDRETYSYYLQQLMPNTEVLNMGVHGYGHDQMLLYLQQEGLKYSPDIVIIGYWAGDAERNVQSFRDYAKPRFSLKNGKLVLRTDHIIPPDRLRSLISVRPRLFDLLSFCVELLSGPNCTKEIHPLTESILDEMLETARNAHFKLVFVRLPCMDDLNQLDKPDRFIENYALAHDATLITIEKYFKRAARRGVRFNTKSHWKAQEHLIAAQGIRAELLKMKSREKISK